MVIDVFPPFDPYAGIQKEQKCKYSGEIKRYQIYFDGGSR